MRDPLTQRCVRPGRGAARTLAAVMALGLLLRPMVASEIPADPDLSTKNLRHAGPFNLRPFVLAKDVGYDDNIRLDSFNQEGDTTATLGVGFDGLLLWGDRGGLRFFGEADRVTFGSNSDLDHWNAAARARGIVLLKRAALSLENRFDSQQERPNTEIDQRLRRNTNVITAAASTLRDGRVGADVAVRRTSVDYPVDDLASARAALRLNRDANALVLGTQVRILPKTTFTLDGVLEDIDFEDDSEGRDSDTYAILPGLRFDPSASLQGHFRMGVKSLSAPDRPQDDTRMTVGDAALSKRLGRSSRIKGTIERDLEFSTLTNNLYFRNTMWTAAFEQYFSRRMSAEVSYGRSRATYPNEVTRPPFPGFPAFQGMREDRRTTYGVALRYRINPRLTLVANVTRMERDSTDDFYDRTRNFYTIGSTYDF